jgi:hypothetical protein
MDPQILLRRQNYIVTLGIVENRPRTFGLNHLLLPGRCNRRF